MIDVFQKKNVDVNAPLHEQEIFLLRPCRNFASVKEGFLECLGLRLFKIMLVTSNRDVIAAFKAR